VHTVKLQRTHTLLTETAHQGLVLISFRYYAIRQR